MARTTDTPRPTATREKDEVTKAAKAKPDHRLPADAAAWVAQNARPAISACLCGCGGTTKGRFVPGHDALLKRALEATAAEGETGDAADSARAALATFGW